MDTKENPMDNKENPVAATEQEESSLISDIETGEGEHEGIGIRESGHGILYHLKLCMLCLLRGMKIQNEGLTFHMTAEHQRLNPFDDIVLLFNAGGIREYHLVQVKHGQLLKEKKITAKDFLKEKFNNWGNQFTLHKYFLGYCKLKKISEFSSVTTNFIVCTNIDLDLDDLEKHYFPIKSYENSRFSEIIKESKGNLYRLVSKEKSVIYKALAGKCGSDDDIEDFINDFTLAVNLPNEQDLGAIIKKEIGDMFDSIDPKLVAPQLQDRLLDWLKQRKGKWLSRGEVGTFTNEIVDEINALPSKGLDFSYKLKKMNDLISDEHLTDFRSIIEDFLVGKEHLLQIINKNSSYLSLLKIHQILKHSKMINDWETNSKLAILYIRFKSLSSKESRSHLQSALSNENNYKLMIIYCKKKDKFSRIFSYLNKIAQICSKMKKKIILITEKPIDMEDLEEEIPTLKIREERDVGFTFLQLISEIKENLLRQKIVSFQENFEKISLSLLVTTEDTENQIESKSKLENIIDYDVLVRLIKGKDLRVANVVEETKVLSDIYLDRHLENTKTFNIIHEKDLSSISNRVVIITDEAGSGKSTLLNSMIKEVKNTKPYIWICRINLINYAEVFSREVVKRSEGKRSYSISETENTQIFFIDTLLNSQADTKLETLFEKKLFRLALQGYMKLFFIFDGFDEICPNYKDVVLDLLMSLNVMKFEKLYVTSRTNGNTCRIEISEAADLKIVPFSKEQQEQFLVYLWSKEAVIEDEKRLVWLRDLATEIRQEFHRTLLENPLMLFLTAEYLKDTVFDIFNGTGEESDKLRYAIAWIHENCNFNFIELCRSFIKNKILIYQVDKSKQSLGNISSENKHKYFMKVVQNIHTHLALTAICGQRRAAELNREQPNIDEYINIELPKIGIVYEHGSTFLFIHRTFTDYFITKFFCSHPSICVTVMETFVRNVSYRFAEIVFAYITESWLDISMIDRNSIDRVKYILTYIGLVRRYRRKTTMELTGDEGPRIDDAMKAKLLCTGLVRKGRQKIRHWEGLSFVYWRLGDYFTKNYIDKHRFEALTRVSNYNHAYRIDRWFKNYIRVNERMISQSKLHLDD